MSNDGTINERKVGPIAARYCQTFYKKNESKRPLKERVLMSLSKGSPNLGPTGRTL